MNFQVGLKEDPREKKYDPKVGGSNNPKCWCFKQSSFLRKSTFKVPTLGIEYKGFDFGKQIYTSEFVKK